jgi:hypothetical protein
MTAEELRTLMRARRDASRVMARYSDEPLCRCSHVKVVHRGVSHGASCAAMRCSCAAFSGASATAGESVAGAPVRADVRSALSSDVGLVRSGDAGLRRVGLSDGSAVRADTRTAFLSAQPPSSGSDPSSPVSQPSAKRDDPATAASS